MVVCVYGPSKSNPSLLLYISSVSLIRWMCFFAVTRYVSHKKSEKKTKNAHRIWGCVNIWRCFAFRDEERREFSKRKQEHLHLMGIIALKKAFNISSGRLKSCLMGRRYKRNSVWMFIRKEMEIKRSSNYVVNRWLCEKKDCSKKRMFVIMHGEAYHFLLASALI